jgi:hypothetical protein
MTNTGPRTRRAVLAGLTTAATAALAGCSSLGGASEPKKETESQTIPLKGAATLDVSNQAGAVSITSEDRDDIAVTITRRAPEGRMADLTFDIERPDERVTLVGTISEDEKFEDNTNMSIMLDVTIPNSLSVGEISGSGNVVEVEGVSGDVSVDMTAGEITLREIDGFVSVSASASDVTISSVGGIDGVETTAGKIDVEVPALRGDTTIESTTGEVTAALAPDLDASVSAETNTGDIEVGDLPITVEESTTGASASGDLGGSKHTLDVETTAGKVTLEKLG